MDLRPYQVDAINRLRSLVGGGKKRLILQMTTGGGKTVCAAELIRLAVSKGKRVLFLAHRRELVRQCADKLRAFGVTHQVIMADQDTGRVLVTYSNPVQVASKDTLWSRAMRSKRIDLPPADLVICDEAHRSLSKTWVALINKYPEATVIGLTATPSRKDGSAMGSIYDDMVKAISCQELISGGYLVPFKVFAPYRPSLKGVKVVAGDYNKVQLEERMDKVELVGDIVANWKELAGDRQTIVFASGIEHSMHICQEFTRAGVTAVHVDGETPPDERDESFKMVMNGDVQVLCNCDVCVEGTDLPPVSCIVLARPTKSIVRYKQMVGRGMRPWPGKEHAVLLDHAGCVYFHGFPEDDVEWSLEGGKVEERTAAKKKAKGESEPIICKKCHCAFRNGSRCPNCGAEVKVRKPKAVKTKDGSLTELKRGETYQATREEKQRFWHYCLGVTANRGQTLRVAAGMYSGHFGEPPWKTSDMSHMPARNQWQSRTCDVFPHFVKERVR